MIESIATPYYFFTFVLVALILNAWAAGNRWQPGRRTFLLGFNILIVGVLFGTWKGVVFYLVYAGFVALVMPFLGPSRCRSGWICTFAVCALLTGLVLSKYVFPHHVVASLALKQIWLTLNLSFITFRMIHLVVDKHSGLIEKVNFLTLLNYTFFAPVSAAGPIHRFDEFEKDLTSPRVYDRTEFALALQRIVKGLLKKVAVAGLLTPYILGNMEPSGNHPLLMLLMACCLYSVYIYFDFSGYSDMAIGAARMLGFKVPENFDRPYLATNLQDFWNRWHMTLSQWLKTYLFYPLNKMLVRRFPEYAGKLNPVIAILITFILAGAWHGDSVGFVIFGFMHGIGIALALVLRRKKAEQSLPRVWVGRAATFLYVSLAWIPFVYPVQEIPWLLSAAFGFQP
jgi:alginate O-acetyltransferase complex protein AlgI